MRPPTDPSTGDVDAWTEVYEDYDVIYKKDEKGLLRPDRVDENKLRPIDDDEGVNGLFSMFKGIGKFKAHTQAL